MTSYFEIPFSGVPETFSVSLNGTSYNIRVYWNVPGNYWVCDLLDSSNTAIILGIPFVTGADLLAQYAYLFPPGAIYAQKDGDSKTPPGFNDFGNTSHAYLVTQ